tara:strand:+ start:1942 stop:2313 length:372 start_codon:yes stop_codon:yes gene_type:complete
MTKDKRIILYVEEKKFIKWCIEKNPPFMKDALIKEEILWRIHKFSMFQVNTTDLVDLYEDWLYMYSPVLPSDLFKFENDDLIESVIANGLLDMEGFGEKYKIKVVRQGTFGYPTQEQLEKGVK